LYIEPKIESSYQKNNLGYTIYETILELNPKVVIDFGILYGYSTVTIAQALKDIGEGGKVIAYDLYEDYEYKNSIRSVVEKNIKYYGVDDIVELKYGNFYQWVDNPDNFDLIHLDISNTGNIIKLATNKLPNKNILFEGGSKERDNENWVEKYNKTKIYPLKSEIGYEILNEQWPSISLVRGQK
jgi:hypothetical protein|tara:strand:+ start:1491 stop:2042 length:552 start_codon:yes stop_codon:yes gene_type:complete